MPMSPAASAPTILSKSENESENQRCSAAEMAATATPSMQQYFTIKAEHPDCLLFFRMGDFYELFFKDAEIASAILDIALTKRGKHGGNDIKMCGVPVHAAENYLERLIASGHKIAICEQLESPEDAKKRGYKAVIKRGVIRIVTPGTVTEEALLAPAESYFLAALRLEGQGSAAIAWLELSTGRFWCLSAERAMVAAELARIRPRELLLSDTDYAALRTEGWFEDYAPCATVLPDLQMDFRRTEAALRQHYGLESLAGLGLPSPLLANVCGALVHYLGQTQMASLPRLDKPRLESVSDYLLMDAATRRNLELSATLSGERRGSVLATLDKTVTAAGGRLFQQWLHAPLTKKSAILARQEAVAWLCEQEVWRERMGHSLRAMGDAERVLSRLALGRGGPRDLLTLRQTLAAYRQLREDWLAANFGHDIPPLLTQALAALSGHETLADMLARALKDEVPYLARDGNFVAAGFRADLDEYRTLRDESKRLLMVMEQELKAATGIPSLKVKHNQVLGYFIEITPIHEKKVPTEFIQRQSLSGALRYSTHALNETARLIEESADKALKLELLVYEELVTAVLGQTEPILAAARAVAQIDVFVSMAEIASSGGWVLPTLTEDAAFEVTAGRHPVVEMALRRQHREFIANDCGLSDQARLWLITGPNMGGKSTFLRQQALILILAQMGSFVPAEAARIGIADKLFCRVGASDDLGRGQSTFMVEMVETAAILNQATPESFVIMDEIGRGTATYDGVSIAWAVAEHLHNATRCRALFATHYHELTDLAESLPALRNYHAAVKEYQGQVVFLHSLRAGAADKSYGIHVAALAGLPQSVLTRAKFLLKELEAHHHLRPSSHAAQGSLPLATSTRFSAASVAAPLHAAASAKAPEAHSSAPDFRPASSSASSSSTPSTSPSANSFPQPTSLSLATYQQLAERLESVNVDNTTPREALDILVELKNLTTESV
ncbi:MAG: DNA mismatch repair protein MutS [Alphaproteobacteria bacterium]